MAVTDRLRNETALVTGATRGLGRVVARMLAAEGATVAITGRDRARGTGLERELIDAGYACRFFATDLTDEAAVNRLVDDVDEEFGALTVLVTCHVAHVRDGAVHDLDTRAWETALGVNLTSTAWLCRAAIGPMLDADRGSIVLISSRAAIRGTPAHAAYTASKGGLNALARSIAVDYAGHGIRCNTISAGYLLHEERDADLDDERRARLEAMHLTRLGQPQDVGHAVVYLASRESELVTGVDLPVDGGSTIARATSLG